jgi:phage tail sheath protein FI
MASFISPGVYIIEQDFSLYAANLSTTITGMVGAAAKGPTNEAVQITSAVQFIETFGEPSPSFYGPYGALEYLQEGQILFYTRVTGPSGYAALYQLLTAEATGVGSITPTNNGTGYTSAPTVTITGDGFGAAAIANITGGGVVSYTMTNVGYGYSSAAVVVTGGGGADAAGTAVLGTTENTAASVQSVAGTFLIGSGTKTLVVTELDYSSGTLAKTDRSITLTEGATQAASTVVSDITGTSGYSGWGFTAATSGAGAYVLLTQKLKSNLHGLQIKSSTTFVGFTNLEQHFGSDVDKFPATISGSISGTVTITNSGPSPNNTFIVNELDRRTGTLVATPRTIAISTGVNRTLQAIANDINTAAQGGGFDLYADASTGVFVLTSAGVENELFGLQVLNSTNGGTSVSEALANSLGLNALSPYYGARAKWLFSATSKGAWGDNVNIKVAGGRTAGTFKITVSYEDVVQEIYDGVSVDPSSDDYVERLINGKSAYIAVTDNTAIAADPGLTGSNGANMVFGNDGLSDLGDADFIGEITEAGGATGLQVYANPEVININLLLVPGASSASILDAQIQLCETRADCMTVLDTPFGLSSQQAISWHNGAGAYGDHAAFNSSYAALYWPWIQVYDPTNRQLVWTPPSGHVARAYAYSDRVAEPWYAPAGPNRGRIPVAQRIEHSATRGERDMMYGNGNAINPIINVPQAGVTIWGQRTLQRKPSDLDRVNVRRLLLYMEKVVATSANYLTFEPNDEILWGQFTDLVSPFAASVKARRGLYDFAIRCDKTTNTAARIDNNEMYGYIILKPTKPAEKIVVTFTLVPTGASLTEISTF